MVRREPSRYDQAHQQVKQACEVKSSQGAGRAPAAPMRIREEQEKALPELIARQALQRHVCKVAVQHSLWHALQDDSDACKQ